MVRFTAIAVAAFLAVLLCGEVRGASGPLLVSAGSRGGHVTVTFSVEGAVPASFVAATSPRTDALGALTSGVRLREPLRIAARQGLLRWRSRAVLARGRYFVQISGVDTDGVTDCLPKQRACGQEWSNVRKVFVSRSSG
jgi:hypothetical protein